MVFKRKLMREHRLAREMTQQDLAEKLDILQEAVCQIERGHRLPTLRQVYIMAKLFGLTMDELVE